MHRYSGSRLLQSFGSRNAVTHALTRALRVASRSVLGSQSQQQDTSVRQQQQRRIQRSPFSVLFASLVSSSTWGSRMQETTPGHILCPDQLIDQSS